MELDAASYILSLHPSPLVVATGLCAMMMMMTMKDSFGCVGVKVRDRRHVFPTILAPAVGTQWHGKFTTTVLLLVLQGSARKQVCLLLPHVAPRHSFLSGFSPLDLSHPRAAHKSVGGVILRLTRDGFV